MKIFLLLILISQTTFCRMANTSSSIINIYSQNIKSNNNEENLHLLIDFFNEAKKLNNFFDIKLKKIYINDIKGKNLYMVFITKKYSKDISKENFIKIYKLLHRLNKRVKLSFEVIFNDFRVIFKKNKLYFKVR